MVIRNNNFNLIRLVLALLVIVSHSWGLLGLKEPTLFGNTFGKTAVHGFFAVSGYLITKSYLSNNNMSVYFLNRSLRLIPAFILASIISNVLLRLFEFYSDNPVAKIKNGPIWTLNWEIFCYIGVAIFGIYNLLNKKSIAIVLFMSLFVYFLEVGSTLSSHRAIAPMMIMFISGAYLSFIDPNKLIKLRVILLISLMLMVNNEIYSWVYNNLLIRINLIRGPELSLWNIRDLIYLAIFPIFCISISISKEVLRINSDISYGLYIYAWPISQSIIAFFILNEWEITPYILCILTLLCVVPLSYISWTLVEKRALELKNNSFVKKVVGRV